MPRRRARPVPKDPIEYARGKAENLGRTGFPEEGAALALKFAELWPLARELYLQSAELREREGKELLESGDIEGAAQKFERAGLSMSFSQDKAHQKLMHSTAADLFKLAGDRGDKHSNRAMNYLSAVDNLIRSSSSTEAIVLFGKAKAEHGLSLEQNEGADNSAISAVIRINDLRIRKHALSRGLELEALRRDRYN